MWTCFLSNLQSHISFQLPVHGHSGQLTLSRNSSMVAGQAGQGKAFQDGREFLRLKGRSQWRGDRKAVEQGCMMGKACSGHRAFARAAPLPHVVFSGSLNGQLHHLQVWAQMPPAQRRRPSQACLSSHYSLLISL